MIRTVPLNGDPQLWTIGDTTDTTEADGLVVTSSRVGDEDYVCSHAMTDKTDLVIDVVVCSRRITDEAETIMHRVAGRLPV